MFFFHLFFRLCGFDDDLLRFTAGCYGREERRKLSQKRRRAHVDQTLVSPFAAISKLRKHMDFSFKAVSAFVYRIPRHMKESHPVPVRNGDFQRREEDDVKRW